MHVSFAVLLAAVILRCCRKFVSNRWTTASAGPSLACARDEQHSLRLASHWLQSRLALAALALLLHEAYSASSRLVIRACRETAAIRLPSRAIPPCIYTQQGRRRRRYNQCGVSRKHESAGSAWKLLVRRVGACGRDVAAAITNRGRGAAVPACARRLQSIGCAARTAGSVPSMVFRP